MAGGPGRIDFPTDASATAAVARSAEARGLGVDVEFVMSGEAADEVARLVASEDETQRAARAAGLNQPESLTLLFSAKEILFKALYPLSRRHFDYLDCEVVRIDPGRRLFGTPYADAFRRRVRRRLLHGRYELTGGEVRTGVLVSEKPPG